MDENQKLTKTLGNLRKNADFIKNAKIREKMLKAIPLLLETMQCPINKPQRRLKQVNGKKTNIFKNLKMRNLSKKIKFVISTS